MEYGFYLATNSNFIFVHRKPEVEGFNRLVREEKMTQSNIRFSRLSNFSIINIKVFALVSKQNIVMTS